MLQIEKSRLLGRSGSEGDTPLGACKIEGFAMRTSTPLAHLASGPGGERIQAVFLCACGSLDVAARGMCPRCLARQHHDREHFGGHREAALKRHHWTCQGCFYRPAQEDRDWIVVHHRVPGVSKPALMISLCAACHAIVERLQAVRTWLPPQLLILWREQHPDAAYQLPLPIECDEDDPTDGPAVFHTWSNQARFNPKVVELER